MRLSLQTYRDNKNDNKEIILNIGLILSKDLVDIEYHFFSFKKKLFYLFSLYE